MGLWLHCTVDVQMKIIPVIVLGRMYGPAVLLLLWGCVYTVDEQIITVLLIVLGRMYGPAVLLLLWVCVYTVDAQTTTSTPSTSCKKYMQ